MLRFNDPKSIIIVLYFLHLRFSSETLNEGGFHKYEQIEKLRYMDRVFMAVNKEVLKLCCKSEPPMERKIQIYIMTEMKLVI